MRPLIRQTWGLLFCVNFLAATHVSGAFSANDEPGGSAVDAQLAVLDPDEFAWQLFVFVNRQAARGAAGVPDPHSSTVTKYTDDRDVVWETWALASRDGQPQGEVFLAKGKKPVEWSQLRRGNGAPKALDRTFTDAGQSLLEAGRQALRAHPGPAFVSSEPTSDEVRMNRAAFEFIRTAELYSKEGLQRAFARALAVSNRDLIQFPAGAKEVKARWDKIQEIDKPRYHWRTINDEIYGLKAFHVISKDLPMWFWSDFIHVDLEPAESVPCRDATTRGPRSRKRIYAKNAFSHRHVRCPKPREPRPPEFEGTL